jgi:hypothetical protein
VPVRPLFDYLEGGETLEALEEAKQLLDYDRQTVQTARFVDRPGGGGGV